MMENTTAATAVAHIEAFFDQQSCTFSYIVYDEPGGHAAVIDPVLDYDRKAGRTKTVFADRLLAFLREKGLSLQWILETHAHADHLSSAHYLQEQAGGKIAIGEHILQVQQVFKKLFHLGGEFVPDGSQFDVLLADNERFQIGKLTAQALLVPGHTPADLAYLIGDAAFIGDTLFMPDVGTARCDFPGGDASHLYQSVQRILALPENTRLFMCHDYPPEQRQAEYQTTVAAQKAQNIHVHDGISEEQFIALRRARDATLDAPVLLLPSIQVNIRAGRMPEPEENGVSYLKIPLNQL
jgi:glyoxylase-like metal-dependent hydrolase (beta-lactamase superfamily II)